MDGTRKYAPTVVGALFLALAVFKLFQGENWIVWFILGALFGGLRFILPASREETKP